MSKKTIHFPMPKKIETGVMALMPEIMPVPEESFADMWVHQQDCVAEAQIVAAQETVIEAEPVMNEAIVTEPMSSPAPQDFLAAVKVAVLFPYLTGWLWALGVTQRSLRSISQ